jgi:hypothetical protein
MVLYVEERTIDRHIDRAAVIECEPTRATLVVVEFAVERDPLAAIEVVSHGPCSQLDIVVRVVRVVQMQCPPHVLAQ